MQSHTVVLPLAVPPATPMKKGMARPKLALALLGDIGVLAAIATTAAPFEDSVFIFRPMPFSTLLTVEGGSSIKQLGFPAGRHDQAAISCVTAYEGTSESMQPGGAGYELRPKQVCSVTEVVGRSAGKSDRAG